MSGILNEVEKEYLTDLLVRRLEKLREDYVNKRVPKNEVIKEIFIILVIDMKLDLDFFRIKKAVDKLVREMGVKIDKDIEEVAG
ncbi:MAG: hypothetical protein DRO12_01080 [Thermoprotei archaeon]|nr:MAG: hypothetical protein DRO12_01080 [Thermoprotei archaeon]